MPFYYTKNTPEGYQIIFRLSTSPRFIEKFSWNREKKKITFCFVCFHFSKRPFFIVDTITTHIGLKALVEIRDKTYETTHSLKEAYDQFTAIRDIAIKAISEAKNNRFYHSPHPNGQKPFDP